MRSDQMGTITVPKRYFVRDPAENFETFTDEQQRNMAFRYLLSSMVLQIENGKPVRTRIDHGFLQIYSAQFLNTRQEDLDQIRGTMIVDMFKIFDRQEGNYSRHDIDPEGFVRLKGPMCPVDARSMIFFYPRVFRKDHPDDLFHPNQACRFGSWKYLKNRDEDVPPQDESGYDGKWMCEERYMAGQSHRIICDEMETACGPLRLTYAVFEDAADCFLTVKLIKWKGKGDVANVYGSISASNSMLPQAKSMVFDRKRDEYERVKLGHYIVMDRPAIVVPMEHQINLTLNLSQCIGDSREDDVVIAKGSCSFKAKSMFEDLSQMQLRQTEVEQILKDGERRRVEGIKETKRFRGKLGQVEITAYWMPCWCRSYCDHQEKDFVDVK